MTSIAVIGAGRMGQALIEGLLVSGRPNDDVMVVARDSGRALAQAQRWGIRAADTVSHAFAAAELVVVAVKPGHVPGVLLELAAAAADGHRDRVLVSFAAGVPTAHMEEALPQGFPVVRVMPNIAVRVAAGVCGIALGRHVEQAHVAMVRDMLESVGTVVTVAETHMDAVTAVSGSGTAYFLTVVEAMIDGAVQLGLPHEVAEVLVRQAAVGAADMLRDNEMSAPDLRAAVTEPAGATAAAMWELERAGLRGAFHEALRAAHRSSSGQGATPVTGARAV